jgi:hypothetical protein
VPAELTSARHERAREGRPVADGSWAAGTQAAGAGDVQEGDGDIYLSSVKQHAEELAQQSQGGLTSPGKQVNLADDDTRDTRGLRDTAAAAPVQPRSRSKGGLDQQLLPAPDTADDRDTMPELELVAGVEVDLTELD